MTEAKLYTCPNCGGQPYSERIVRIKRRDGDYLEKWPNYCGLCDNGQVTLDMIVERATDPMEYIERLIAPPAPVVPSPDDDEIPF